MLARYYVVDPNMAEKMNSRSFRQVYLITYSKANLDLFPNRKSFSDAVADAFTTATTAKLVQWVCSRELHADGASHYHMALKLDKCHRWVRFSEELLGHPLWH